MRYKFRENSPFKNEDANVVGKFLETHFPNQNPNPEEIVSLSRKPRAPTYKYFDWNDRTAAEKFRLHQARSLINALFVELSDGTKIRAYEKVYVQDIDSSQYLAIGKISESEDLWRQVVDTALRDLGYWKAKYTLYKDYFPAVFSAIGRAEKEQASVKNKEKNHASGRTKGANPSD